MLAERLPGQQAVLGEGLAERREGFEVHPALALAI
jgi:hypothetical protein